MTLWLILAVMTAIALAFVLVPLSRREIDEAPRLDYDIEVYRDQLEEIDRDLDSGMISGKEADAARNEVRRRLLAAADGADKAAKQGRSARRTAALVVAVALPIGALATYFAIGTPDAPDQLAAVEHAPAPQVSGADQEQLAELVRRAEANPKSSTAWADLGDGLVNAGQVEDAVTAYATAVELDDTNPALRAAYGEALTMAAGGMVTPAAKTEFQNAVFLDPQNPRARYYIGLALYQSGRAGDALQAWSALERDSPQGAPWLPMLDARIAEVAAEAGIDTASLNRREAGPPGPTDERIADAANMSEQERLTMIDAMVGQLAARLEENPADLEGWVRLARSYEVLGRTADARDAAARAAELSPEDPTLLVQLGRLTYEAEGAPPTVSPAVAEIMGRVLTLKPNDGLALWFTGVAAEQDGEPERARELWTRLLAQLEAGSPQYGTLKARIDALDSQE